jgi:putative toxin-antitoxin system antitoxin component (TIGR02293 family)
MAGIKTTKKHSKPINLLGGEELGGLEEHTDIQDAIRNGLPFSTLEKLAKALELSDVQVSAVLGIAPRTLARRKRQRHLSPVESDRVYRVARIAQLAFEMFGEIGKTRRWLNGPNRALGGATPLTMLDTEIGARRVEEVLLHINYGIYA